MQWNSEDFAALAANNRATQQKCYVEFSPILYTTIWKICGNKETANDLLHDSFIAIFKNVSQYNQNYSFISWLKRIAINNTFNHLKRQKTTLKVVEQLEHDSHESFIEPNTNPLDKLLFILPPEHRMVIWMSIVEQYTHKEISEITGRSESYSKSIVARSLVKLRNTNEVKLNVAY